jgi:gliding motility-associated protein GldE
MSGSEVAFFSLSPKDVSELRKENDESSTRILRLLKRPGYLLSTILIGNNLVNVGIIICSFYLTSKVLLDSNTNYDILGLAINGDILNFFLNVVFVTFILVLFGEVIPKVYATQYNIRLARFMSGPLLLLRKGFWPLSTVLVSSTRLIEKRLKKSGADISIEELDKAIDLTTDDEATKQEIKMLKGVVKFGNLTVRQIMRSRVDIIGVELSTPFLELMEVVKSSGYSRIPIYEEDLDHIKGILYVKDLLGHLDAGPDFVWQDLIRESFYVPESKKIDDLFRDIQEKRVHMAIVVDEYGGTEGLITLEDIVEEVVGEIKDEFDDIIELSYQKIDDHNFIFEGKALINDVCKIMGLEQDTFDAVKGEADSVGGLVLEIGGRIPTRDDEVSFEQYSFKVLQVGNNRIERVKVSVQAEKEKTDA